MFHQQNASPWQLLCLGKHLLRRHRTGPSGVETFVKFKTGSYWVRNKTDGWEDRLGKKKVCARRNSCCRKYFWCIDNINLKKTLGSEQQPCLGLGPMDNLISEQGRSQNESPVSESVHYRKECGENLHQFLQPSFPYSETSSTKSRKELSCSLQPVAKMS